MSGTDEGQYLRRAQGGQRDMVRAHQGLVWGIPLRDQNQTNVAQGETGSEEHPEEPEGKTTVDFKRERTIWQRDLKCRSLSGHHWCS